MDWNAMTGPDDPIERNREALKGILATLLAMAGLGSNGQLPFFPQEGAAASGLAPAEKSKLSPALTLTRRVHSAVLSLLRPAESAARRLIIALARGIVVTLPGHPRKARPKLVPVEPVLRRLGIAVTLSRADMAARAAAERAASERAARRQATPARLSFPLLDPLKRWSRRPRRRYDPARAVPRIRFFDDCEPVFPPPPPSPHDAVDATRLALRLEALASALDDLPGQAKRFARWKARRDQALAAGRAHRVSPLRLGRPPGGRLSRYDPDARRRCNIRDVDEILAHAHALAHYALRPDTS